MLSQKIQMMKTKWDQARSTFNALPVWLQDLINFLQMSVVTLAMLLGMAVAVLLHMRTLVCTP